MARVALNYPMACVNGHSWENGEICPVCGQPGFVDSGEFIERYSRRHHADSGFGLSHDYAPRCGLCGGEVTGVGFHLDPLQDIDHPAQVASGGIMDLSIPVAASRHTGALVVEVVPEGDRWRWTVVTDTWRKRPGQHPIATGLSATEEEAWARGEAYASPAMPVAASLDEEIADAEFALDAADGDVTKAAAFFQRSKEPTNQSQPPSASHQVTDRARSLEQQHGKEYDGEADMSEKRKRYWDAHPDEAKRHMEQNRPLTSARRRASDDLIVSSAQVKEGDKVWFGRGHMRGLVDGVVAKVRNGLIEIQGTQSRSTVAITDDALSRGMWRLRHRLAQRHQAAWVHEDINHAYEHGFNAGTRVREGRYVPPDEMGSVNYPDAWLRGYTEGSDTNPDLLSGRSHPMREDDVPVLIPSGRWGSRQAAMFDTDGSDEPSNLFGGTSSDEFDEARTPHTTRPRVMPTMPSENPVPGGNHQKQVSDSTGNDVFERRDLHVYKDVGYSMPSFEQQTAAKVARISRKVLDDNPHLSRDEAQKIATEAVKRFPEMVKR